MKGVFLFVLYRFGLSSRRVFSDPSSSPPEQFSKWRCYPSLQSKTYRFIYMPIKPFRDIFLGIGAGPFSNHSSIFKKNECWNRANAIFFGHVGIFIHFELDHLDLSEVIVNQLLKEGGDGVTRSTPGRPKPHQNKLLAQ